METALDRRSREAPASPRAATLLRTALALGGAALVTGIVLLLIFPAVHLLPERNPSMPPGVAAESAASHSPARVPRLATGGALGLTHPVAEPIAGNGPTVRPAAAAVQELRRETATPPPATFAASAKAKPARSGQPVAVIPPTDLQRPAARGVPSPREPLSLQTDLIGITPGPAAGAPEATAPRSNARPEAKSTVEHHG